MIEKKSTLFSVLKPATNFQLIFLIFSNDYQYLPFFAKDNLKYLELNHDLNFQYQINNQVVPSLYKFFHFLFVHNKKLQNCIHLKMILISEVLYCQISLFVLLNLGKCYQMYICDCHYFLEILICYYLLF